MGTITVFHRFLVFGFYKYYPNGGMGDCTATFPTIQEVENYITNNENIFDYFNIFDCENMIIVNLYH